MSGLELLWLIITVISGIAGATIYVVSQVRKTRTDELAELASTRGQWIIDLEKHIQRLESRISKLEGAYDALQQFKVEEIADAVVAKLVGDNDVNLSS